MTPLLMGFIIGAPLLIIVAIAAGFKFGFQKTFGFLFFFIFAGAILAMIVLPLLFPSLNEGLGVGIIIVAIAAPILAILGIINLIILISNHFRHGTSAISSASMQNTATRKKALGGVKIVLRMFAPIGNDFSSVFHAMSLARKMWNNMRRSAISQR